MLINGTNGHKSYHLGNVTDGAWTLLVEADDGNMYLVRPSNDGSRVFVFARVYSPTVWQLTRP